MLYEGKWFQVWAAEWKNQQAEELAPIGPHPGEFFQWVIEGCIITYILNGGTHWRKGKTELPTL